MFSDFFPEYKEDDSQSECRDLQLIFTVYVNRVVAKKIADVCVKNSNIFIALINLTQY